MRYHFRTVDGHTCCSSDDVRLLCDRCRARARNQEERKTMKGRTTIYRRCGGIRKAAPVARPPWRRADGTTDWKVYWASTPPSVAAHFKRWAKQAEPAVPPPPNLAEAIRAPRGHRRRRLRCAAR